MLRKLGIEPGEGKVFAWAAAVLFLLGWTEVSVKNASEVLFVKTVGVASMPAAFLANSVLLVISTIFIGLLAARSDRVKLLPRVFLALAFSLFPLWILVVRGHESAVWLLILASKQLESIGLLVFWMAMGDLLHGRQAKRLFAPLMAGVTLGSILGSFASEPISRITGIEGVLPISAAALVLAAAMSWPLRHLRAARLERGVPIEAPRLVEGTVAEPERPSVTGFAELWSDNRLFRLLFVVAACSGLVGPMLYFQFQYVADVATQGADGAEQLMAFYAQFRGWISVGVLATQLGVASNLYRRIGVPLAAAISPLIYLLGFLGLTFRLSLPAGVFAMAGSKLQDDAIFDPAIRVLFNLFPESIRPRAMWILEGPVKRGGGALGNLANMAAVGLFGSVAWVGAFALPVASLWLVVALVLWRAYPSLLMQASLRRSHFGDDFDASEFLDANTLRGLAGSLRDPDPARCRVAIELVSEADPVMAAEIFAEAAAAAPAGTQVMLIEALDGVLETSVAIDVTSAAAAAHLEALLDRQAALGDRERANLVQAYGRLIAGIPSPSAGSGRVLARALGDSAPAVRLAAAAAFHHHGVPPQGVPDLPAALLAAATNSDPLLREIAREEHRALLVRDEPSAAWDEHLAAFADLAIPEGERAVMLEVLADVAAHHGERAAGVSDRVLQWREHSDPRARAAILRFVGHAGLADHSGWVVSHIAADEAGGGEAVRAAARESLRALGSRATDALLVELSFGKRSVRDAILPLVRELDLATVTLREVYDRELGSIRRMLVDLYGAASAGLSPILLQRLGERLDERVNTALHLLAAVHDDDRIANVAVPLRRARGSRQYAILLEALEAMLSPTEKDELLPLLEDRSASERGRVAAEALGVSVPSGAEVEEIVLDNPDELTRSIAFATLDRSRLPDAEIPDAARPDRGMASGTDVRNAEAVLTPVERAMVLRSVPLFEGMTTRQLMDVAEVVGQEVHPPHTVVSREGEYSDCMYIIVEGRVAITKGDTVLNQLGPNDFFGEIAVFEGTTRSADVTTREEPVSLLRLGRDDLLSLMEELPGIAICICQTLSRRVRNLTERVHV